jgi:hypothetical protein
LSDLENKEKVILENQLILESDLDQSFEIIVSYVLSLLKEEQ